MLINQCQFSTSIKEKKNRKKRTHANSLDQSYNLFFEFIIFSPSNFSVYSFPQVNKQVSSFSKISSRQIKTWFKSRLHEVQIS